MDETRAVDAEEDATGAEEEPTEAADAVPPASTSALTSLPASTYDDDREGFFEHLSSCPTSAIFAFAKTVDEEVPRVERSECLQQTIECMNSELDEAYFDEDPAMRLKLVCMYNKTLRRALAKQLEANQRAQAAAEQ